MSQRALPLNSGERWPSPGGAEISADELYRWILWRRWAPGPALVSIGLNPSTADATTDDQTIRRERSYAQALGFGALIKPNLYAIRMTDNGPIRRKEVLNPIGDLCDHWFIESLASAGLVLAAWGAFPWALPRARYVAGIAAAYGHELHALAVTADGSPRHTSRLPNGLTPKPYRFPPMVEDRPITLRGGA